MKYLPHAYQRYATNFILSHPEAAVFLTMGLGKSVITLTALLALFAFGEIRRVLVVAPLRVARDTWPEEIRKWDHLQELTYSVAVGTEKERLAALRQDAMIHIINRENIPWLVEKSGLPFDYDMVVIDELSSFKNHQAKRFRSLMWVRPSVSRIVGLTGTPSANGFMDLFAEFRLLDMGKRLGNFIMQYRAAYFLPDKRSADRIFSWKLRPGADQQIYQRIRDITVSMRSEDYLKMPEYVSTRVPVRMDAAEWDMYDRLKEDFMVEIVGRPLQGKPGLESQVIDAKNAGALCTKLSQLAGGAIYDELGKAILVHNRKLEALGDLIEGANGHPLLIAYWFQHDLTRIQAAFPKVRHLTSAKDFSEWNRGEIPVAAIHPASAGHGLNLQAGGNTLVWFSIPWSLELYQQTNARLYRQGQRSQTVFIHHLITAGTIDEDILEALNQKTLTQESLMRAVKAHLS